MTTTLERLRTTLAVLTLPAVDARLEGLHGISSAVNAESELAPAPQQEQSTIRPVSRSLSRFAMKALLLPIMIEFI
jgi:hypothetical protein